MERTLNIQTPYYLFDLNRFSRNLMSLRESFRKRWSNLVIGYSFKTNSLLWILNWIRQQGVYAEVVSAPEHELARFLKYNSSNIILNGPYKGWETFEYALENNSIVNIDSFHEVKWLEKHFPRRTKMWKIGLRINFDLESYCPGETIMGSQPSRFGFNIENGSLEKALVKLRKLPHVEIAGFHAHYSTKTKSLKIFKEISRKLMEVSLLVDYKIEYLDIGGGFFGDMPGKPTYDEYAEVVSSILRTEFNSKKLKLIIEPGAALVASSFSYVCKVIDVRDVEDTRIVTTDGSCLNIDPHIHGIKFQVDVLSNGRERKDRQVVTGYTCMEKDRMAELENYPELNIGDLLIFRNIGAYSMILSSLFIQYFPAVVVKDKDRFYYARRPWDINDYLRKSYLADSEEVKR